jgi:methionyl-tRNA formyltransferase
MTKMSETVVFFGSGPVAAKSLELLAENFSIEAVVTKPKPTHHKGAFPVLEVSNKLGLSTHTVSNKAELSALFAKQPFASKLGVLIDFGIIVNQDVIDYFPLGIINSHFSLLPQWRGADPITFAILNGDAQTGVSLMLLVAAMDKGPLLAQAPFQIPENCTTPELTETLIDISDKTLAAILPEYLKGKVQPMRQNPSIKPTYSRKLTKNDGAIDWHKPAGHIEREIRAFTGWPQSRTSLGGKDVIITAAHVAGYEFHGPGEVVGQAFETPDDLIGIATGKGVLVIDKLKPAGKAEMTAKAFLAGNRL